MNEKSALAASEIAAIKEEVQRQKAIRRLVFQEMGKSSPPAGTRSREPLPTCGFGVYAPTEEQNEACGKPAVAVWHFDSGTMHVCEEHDRFLIGEAGDD